MHSKTLRKLSKVNRDTRAGQKNRIFVQSLFFKPSSNPRGMVATELKGERTSPANYEKSQCFCAK